MRKLLKIKVTTEDIIKGRRNSTDRCPIARAAKRVLKKVDGVMGDVIDFKFDTILQEDNMCILPIKAQRFIAHFDDDKKVKPFTFQVSVPVKFIR